MEPIGFDVFLDCRTGTWACGSGGWQPEYHVVRWCREYSEAEARAAVARQAANPIQVRGAWYEAVFA